MNVIYHTLFVRLSSLKNLKKKNITILSLTAVAIAAYIIHYNISKRNKRKNDHQNKPPQSDPPQITNSMNNPPQTNPPQAIDPQHQKNNLWKQVPQVNQPQMNTFQQIYPQITQLNYTQISTQTFNTQNAHPQPVNTQNKVGKATTPDTSDCYPSSPSVVHPNIILKDPPIPPPNPPIPSPNPQDELMVDIFDEINTVLKATPASLSQVDSQYHNILPKDPPIPSPNPQDELMVDKCDEINTVLKAPLISLLKVDSQYHTLQFTSPKAIELIKYLLDKSSGQRNVDENFKKYIFGTLEKNDFQNHYSVKKIDVKQKLSKYCTKMISVRGDGNCFYTSFGYQLLKLVIYQYSNEEFETFLNQNFTMPFRIQLKDQILENQEQGQILLRHFKDRIIYLRNLEKNYQQNDNYQNQLMRHFRAHANQDFQDDYLDGYFQPLTVLFLRNLSMHIVENCEEGQNVYDKENLLKWEEECNCNEQVIALLAQHLKQHIQLLFFKDGDFQLLEYSKECETQNRTIILLIQPGHYNIGLKN